PSLRPFLEAAIRAADPTNPLFSGATVQLWGAGTSANPYFFRVLAGRGGSSFNPILTLTFSDTTVAPDILATSLHLDAGAVPPAIASLQQYPFSSGTDDPAIDDV